MQHDAITTMINDNKDEDPTEKSGPSSSAASVKEVEIVATEVAGVTTTTPDEPPQKKAARKLYDEEKRAVGRIAKNIWIAYFKACGSWVYWLVFTFVFVLASLTPIVNNGWLSFVHFLLSPRKSNLTLHPFLL